jgi:ribosomal protein L40E
MEQRVYQGTIDPDALVRYLLDTWNQGETAAQALESDEGIIVQIGQRHHGLLSDEPRSALTLALEPLREGLRVTLGEQQWYRDGGGQVMVGGLIGFFPFFFTWPLGGGQGKPVDPQLTQQVLQTVEQYIAQYGAVTGETRRLPQQAGAATGPTTRLDTLHCPSCGTENPAAAERCRECGTYLQARDCPQCGVSNPATAHFCMRCGNSLIDVRSVGS